MSETRFWNGYANMGVLRDDGVTIVRGRGSTVYDDRGRAYLDAIGGLWYGNVGWGRDEIADTVARQMRELPVYQTFEFYKNRPAETLASRIAALAPMRDARVFLVPGGGSDAIDTAAKLARAYWRVTGKPEKHVVLSREFAYHGMNAYGTSLGGIPANLAVAGTIVPDVERVPWSDASAVRQAIERHGPDKVAAFFCEPVIGAGGVLHPPQGYLADVQAACREHDVLFVVDEVITGFGRLGEWFGAQRFSLEPDLMTCAKGLTSGYLPLGAVIVGERVAEPFWRRGTTNVFRHGYTYGGHPAACAAALANLDILEREGLLARVRRLESVLAAALRPLSDHPVVAEVRSGLGLLAAVELKAERLAERPELVARAVVDARQRGVLTRGLRGVALQVSPPFVITEPEIDETARVFAETLDALA
ncbi:MAG TPA: aminotransferase class III-fold pyridoxal phosphate-dependent enzyme [Vicinamibacteria bacterium]|nr:aminotransferase class III-fold pyridoxal phosphate-dependent enzyme [Vicinamibacteria bacterium]